MNGLTVSKTARRVTETRRDSLAMMDAMSPRRLAAAGGLGLVAALVAALVVTGDSDDPAPAAGSTADPAPVSTVPADDDAAGADGATATEPDVAADDRSEGDTANEPVIDGVDSQLAAIRAALDHPLVPDLPDRGEHPPLREIDGWQQTDVSSLEELRGKVVAVQFWTFGCHNCTATIPHLQELYAKYGGDEFEIVGIHAPEFDHERDPGRIAEAAVDLGVTWPIALDTEKRTFRTWQTERRFWPRIFLIDQDGNVRYDKIGEGRYDEIDAAVGALIAEGRLAELDAAAAAAGEDLPSNSSVDPEA